MDESVDKSSALVPSPKTGTPATDTDSIRVYTPEVQVEWRAKKLPLTNSDVWVCQIREDFLVCLHNRAKKQILEHATETIRREVGGALIGGAYRHGQYKFLEITAAIRGNFTRGNAARLTFTADTWAEIIRIAETEFKDQRIVGWYHTHPNWGVFLSDLDLDIQNNFFDQPDQVALVIDPIRKEGGFFYGTQKNNDKVQESETFSWDHTLYFPPAPSQTLHGAIQESPQREQQSDSSILRRTKVFPSGHSKDSGRVRLKPSAAAIEPPVIRVTAADISQQGESILEESRPSTSVVFDVARGFALAVLVGLAFILLVGGAILIFSNWDSIVSTWNLALKEFPIVRQVLNQPIIMLLGCLVLLIVGAIIVLIVWSPQDY